MAVSKCDYKIWGHILFLLCNRILNEDDHRKLFLHRLINLSAINPSPDSIFITPNVNSLLTTVIIKRTFMQ